MQLKEKTDIEIAAAVYLGIIREIFKWFRREWLGEMSMRFVLC